VTLGPLVFFSTQTGDAWLLDVEDDLALCLARDGSPQPVRVVETEKSVGVAWDRQFQIDEDVFTTMDKSGRVSSVMGYPTRDILEAIGRARQPQRRE
jgi:hypothetical protein